MMKLSVRLSYRISPSRSQQSNCNFRSLSGSPNLLNMPAISPPGSRQGRARHLPLPPVLRLLFPLANMEGGRNFEGSLPPSQTQVGGVLGWHWPF